MMTRRAMLGRMAAVGGAAVAGPGLLAACGGDDDGAAGNGGGSGGGNSLTISNWPAYIDEETVGLFREETGIDLTYTEDYNDNTEYFARIQPDLAAGNTIAPDIFMPTYWLVPRLIELGYLEEIPLDDIENLDNVREELRNPSWDPEGRYSLPWVSGMTGIGYDVTATGRELTSINDLFDPEFRGRVGMLSEMRDTVGLVMLGTGVDPAEATFENASEAFDRIEQARNDGQVRQFTGNDYMDDLASGGFVACIAWSGDVGQLQLDNPNLRFAVPDEGGMLWTDTMVIPRGASNVDNAAAWMNYVYEPENAARIAEYIGFVPPIDGVEEVFAQGDEEQQELAEDPLMFPDDAIEARLHVFAPLSEEEEARFDERFSEIIGA